MSNSKNLQKAIKKAAQEELSRRHLSDFTNTVFDGEFDWTKFHETYYEILDRFCKKQIKKLIVSVPPQHGKSQGSTRLSPSFILGRNPDIKIAVASYNSTFAKKFNRDVQRIIDTQEYYDVYPLTYLNESNVVTVSDNYLRNSEEFEIVNKKGGLKAVGRGGALTGNAVDVMIMDDIYKDYAESNSPIIREAAWDWYTTVVKTRLHNDSQELIVFTRWHEDDLIGRLEKKEKVITVNNWSDLDDIPKGAWVKINFEAIKTGEPTEIDQREAGEVLYEKKHSLDKLMEAKGLDDNKFQCLYQGNPISQKGLLYKPFKTYQKLPPIKEIKNVTDTADGGSDYLCSICYATSTNENDNFKYVLDIYYSDEGAEITEEQVARMLDGNDVRESTVESNSGGAAFARNLERLVNRCVINQKYQSTNKESRIVSNAATVNNEIVFPENWSIRWPIFYENVTLFKKLFKANKHDDGPDALTMIIEEEENGNYLGPIW